MGSLIAAEVLKLRRRRGLVFTSLCLVLGVTLLVFVVRIVLHASSPQTNDPAGGVGGYRAMLIPVVLLGALVATGVGATAGCGDHTARVFRDLVATGRSRMALYAARLPGALAVTFALVAPAWLAAVIVSQTLAAGVHTPGAGRIGADAVWVALGLLVQCSLACGIAALAGSRGWVIGGLIILILVIEPILSAVHFLGEVRLALPGVAIDQFANGPLQHYDVSGSRASAVLVIAGWVAASFAIGAWRTLRRDA